MYKQIILSKILEYIRLKKIAHKGTKCLNFHCPLCESVGLSANVIPNTAKICCYQCGKGSPRYFNLIDVARKVENLPNATDEEILTLLRNELNLTVTTQKDETEISVYLDKYAERGWALVPCAKASPMTATEKIFTGKEPIQKEWQKIQNRDKAEWFHWIDSSLNIGVRTGEVSNLCVIDFDFLSKQEKADLVKEGTSEKRIKEINAKKVIPENIKSIMGETLIQETLGGFHLFYQATDLPKGYIKFGELHIDIETENGQVVIFPSFQTAVVEEYKDGEDIKERIVGYAKRKWLNDLPVAKMPDALYELLKQNKSKKETKIKDEKSDIEEAIITENFKIKDFKNNRHNTMAKVGGILRKNLNILQVKNALSVFNNCVFDEPLPKNEVSLIVDSLDKYIGDEENNIVNNIIEFLTETDIASKSDIELAVFGQKAVSENKLRFEKALTNLILKHKIAKQGLRNYKLVREMKGSGSLLNVGRPINFKMPYFNDYAHFNYGDIILIGAIQKYGKCIANGYILSNQGMIDIEDIGQYHSEGWSEITKHMRIYSAHKKSKSYRKPNKFYKEKVNKTIKIKTHHGYELEGTPEHPIKVVRDDGSIIFKELKDIKINDKAFMVIPNMFKKEPIKKPYIIKYKENKYAHNTKSIKLPETIEPKIAKLMGYIIGDGTLGINNVTVFQDKKYPLIIKEVIDLFNYFGIKPVISYEGDCVNIKASSILFANWIRIKAFNIYNKTEKNLKSPKRFIPACILKADKESQKEFISALFSCESNLNIPKKGEISLEICMASQKIMKTLHIMLLNFGIISNLKIKKVKNYEYNTYWRINITSEMTKKFLDIFQPIKYKLNLFNKKPRRSANIKWVGNNQFNSQKYFEDKIVSIENLNEEKYVYDFNMSSEKYSKEPQFWSNGFVSHNTTLSMNIVKRIVKQHIQPDYFYNESGGRFAKTALKLEMKDDDFIHYHCPNPMDVIIRPNKVCVMDWIRPVDFSKTADIFASLVEKLENAGSIMIAFVQLKQDGEWFAPNLINQFVSLSAKYKYLDKDGIMTELEIDNVRDRKSSGKQWKIPCQYNDETKEVQMIEEIDAQEREINRKISVQKDIEDQRPEFNEVKSVPPEVQQVADTIGQSISDFENFEVK